MGEVMLKIFDDLIPYEEQLTGEWNDELVRDRLEYNKF